MKEQRNIKITLFICICLIPVTTQQKTEVILKGDYISSDKINLEKAFDGEITTSFSSSKKSNGWIGLKLDKKYVITEVGWAQTENDDSNYLLGIFEGANDPSFIDAFPLFMITEKGIIGEMNYHKIDVSFPFKYVRYVGPNEKYCIISELEFSGYEASEEEEEKIYHPTKLPLVVIHTEGEIEPYDKEHEINSNILILKENKINLNAKGKVRLRGNGSLSGEKKPYRIKFDSKQNVLGLKSKAKKWTLLANYFDKSLIRNALAFKISTIFEMKYTPGCEFVDVMVNGEFKGNYNLCDQVEVKENRVEITEMDKNCKNEPELTGGYLVEADAYGLSEKSHFYTNKGILITIKYPDEDEIIDEQSKYIKNYFDKIESEVYELNVENIDINSFVKYMLIQEFAANPDMTWSTYMTKERDNNKTYFGPVWDFDICFDNDARTYPINNKTNFPAAILSLSAGTMRIFTLKILSNEEVLQKYKEEWEEITKEKLTKNVLIDFIDEQNKLINESQKLNFIRWDILNSSSYYLSNPKGTYEEHILYLKDYVGERIDRLDEMIKNLSMNNINESINVVLKFEKENQPKTETETETETESFKKNIAPNIIISFLLSFILILL